MLDADQLLAELATLGWSPKQHGKQTWRTHHDTAEGPLDVFVRLDSHWVVASIVPFLATHGDNSFDLMRWTLRMNRDMRLSKFCVDEDGDLVLSTELPTENLDPEELHEAFAQLLKDAVKHRKILREAAGR